MNALTIVVIVALVALLALLVVWLYMTKKARKAAGGADEPAASNDEIGLLIRDANQRLAKSATGGRVATTPVFVVMGESGAAKTSIVTNSGLDPELLAGHVFQDGHIAPTRSANLWFSRNVVFVEAGGPLASDARAWSKLASRLRSTTSALSRADQAPRAAIVCFDCESFSRGGAQQAVVESARKLRARLGELSEALGINLPVYVLFTRADRLPFFAEYVRNLSNEEASQALGATLPVAGNVSEGVYAEQQTARLTGEFERIFRQLAGLRIEFLPREQDPSKLPPCYEFPREFRKLRTSAVQFMVDLCRPSQLTVGPFLRGFYFSGARPVVVNEAAPITPQPQATFTGGSEATSLFRAGGGPAAAAPAPQMVARHVPQWMFLGHLFTDVLLADRIAMRAAGDSAARSMTRRILFASAAALSLLLFLAFTISFFRNRGLEADVREAALAIPPVELSGSDAASLDTLKKLDTLRLSVAKLVAYRSDTPWSYRWGLYTGDDMLPAARRVYFERFRQVLLSQTEAEIASFLRTLPPVAGPEYSLTYDALKAYIITTSHPEKSTVTFLAPELVKWWNSSRGIDTERVRLARAQFEFYAAQLPEGNPFPGAGDEAAVTRGRRYLAQFAGVERVYAFMLAETSKGIAPVNFNRQFPGSAQTVVESFEVPGAFTKSGWTAMKDAIAHADRYFSGEQWVLGEQTGATVDRARLESDIRARYYSDFIKNWRTYIKSANVVRYAGLKDAAQKLMQLSGNQSPLLELLAVASQHTAVDDPTVAAVFQPAQAVVPPGATDKFIAPNNQNYMNALVALQTSIEGVANQPGQPNDAAVAPILNNAAQAKINTRQMAQAFRIDAEGHVESGVQKILEDPITYAEALLRTLGPAELNGKGKALCSQFRAVMGKYPFNPASSTDATVTEVNALFRRPDGALWTFYEQSLQKALVKQGAQYVVNPSGGVSLSPSFVGFFNTTAAFAEALYAGGSQDPHFSYTLTPEPGEGTIQNMTIRLDGETLTYSGGKGAPKQFTWKGSGAHESNATLKFGNGPDLTWSENAGLWAAFRFFAEAERSARGAGNNETLEWVIRAGRKPIMLPSGKPLTVRFTLDMNGAPRVFDRAFFSRMACVADVARP